VRRRTFAGDDDDALASRLDEAARGWAAYPAAADLVQQVVASLSTPAVRQ